MNSTHGQTVLGPELALALSVVLKYLEPKYLAHMCHMETTEVMLSNLYRYRQYVLLRIE